MKLKIIILIFLISLSACVSVEKHNKQITKRHSIESLKNDVDNAYTQLKKHHPRLYQYTSEKILAFKFDSLKKTIRTPMFSRDFYKKLAPVIAQMKHGHTNVFPPAKKYSKKEQKERAKKIFEFNRLNFEYLQGKLYVNKARKSEHLLIGAEVVKIENEKVSDLISTYKKRFTSDGYNRTFYDRVLGKHFKSYYFRDKGSVDRLSITFKIKDSTFTRTYKRVLKKASNFASKNKDSIKKSRKKRTKEEHAIAKLKRKKKRRFDKINGFDSATGKYNRNLMFIGKDSAVAFLKIRSFSLGNYKKFYKQSFKKIADKDTKDLIIDLRYNGGGSAKEINDLYAYLTNNEFQFLSKSETNSRFPIFKAYLSNTTPVAVKGVVLLFSPIIATYLAFKTEKENGQFYYQYGTKIQQPNPLRFKGNVYVLINGYSFSSSAVLSTHLKANKRATFVGEETGGSYNGTVAGFFKVHELPASKVKVRIGLMNIETPFKQQPDGYGIKPDIKIIPTIEDRREKKDPELDWVLKNIEKQ